jgi:predicted MFS family arabinose efflux permease
MELELTVFRLGFYVSSMSTVTDHMTVTSTSTSRAPGRERIITAPLLAAAWSSFAALSSFFLMLSVMPMYVAAAGHGGTSAGLVTGALMLAGVIAEFAATSVLNRCGSRWALAAGAVLLGAPSLLLCASGSLPMIVVVCVLRGLGFGLTEVVIGYLVVTLLPANRRGEGLGLFGVAACVPGIVALPAGVWLAGRVGYVVVFVLAAALALAALASLRWLGRPARTGGPEPAGGEPIGLVAGLRDGGQLRLVLIFAATTVSAGVVVAFLPLAAGASGASGAAALGLLMQAATATLTRWWAGRHGDRHGHAGLLLPGLVSAAAGMAALIWVASPVAMIAGMALFGAGFGIVQNATLALMIARVPASGYGMASAAWNLAYDAGYGAGPAVFGVLVVHTGYPAAFACTGVLMLAALVPARRVLAGARFRGGV